jgi:hypothetical protein
MRARLLRSRDRKQIKDLDRGATSLDLDGVHDSEYATKYLEIPCDIDNKPLPLRDRAHTKTSSKRGCYSSLSHEVSAERLQLSNGDMQVP